MSAHQLELNQKLNNDFSSKETSEHILSKAHETKMRTYTVDRIPTNDSQMEVNNFHVASCSDKHTPKEDFVGIVVYSFDGKLEWTLNGSKYKCGYIVYKKTKNLRGNGTLHSQCFVSAFGKTAVDFQNDGHSIIISGFSYEGSKSRGAKGFVFGSSIFNEKDCCYFCGDKNNTRAMSSLEQTGIKQAIKNWDCGTSAAPVCNSNNKNFTDQDWLSHFFLIQSQMWGGGLCGW